MQSELFPNRRTGKVNLEFKLRYNLICSPVPALTGFALLLVATLPPVASLRAQQPPVPDLGPGASLHGKAIFPASDLWNTDVSHWPVDPDSAALIAEIGGNKPLHPDFGAPYQGVPNGIPYVVVDAGSTPAVPVTFQYADESDPGPYPIPPEAPIEGGVRSAGDRHVLVVDRCRWRLYELFDAHPPANGASWYAGSGAIFDLATDTIRPSNWTSADAAGLPIFPGLVRYDEVRELGTIRHALRFTCAHTRRAYVAPARHFASASDDPRLPPMGMRVRLRANFNVNAFPPAARVILTALQTYGMILADNGADWFLSGTPDPRWNDEELGTLKRVKGSDFEVVRTR